MNTDLRKKSKNDFEIESFLESFLELTNNAAFLKSMENVRKHRDIMLVANEEKRTYLVPELKYHTTYFFLKIYQ